LAEALGINTDVKDKSGDIIYSEGLVTFAKLNTNSKFVSIVEKAFAE
jgi:transcriptional repressor NF-X1